MNPLVPQTAGLMAVQESIKAVSNMVSEIAQYKRAIAELEMQRLKMLEQAKIVHHQIQVQHQEALHRMDRLSEAFKQTMQQNEAFIAQHAQRENDLQQQFMMILQQISQTDDLSTKQLLQSMWKELLHQLNLNREESSRLQAQLMDANQQFGFSISHRDQSLKDVI